MVKDEVKTRMKMVQKFANHGHFMKLERIFFRKRGFYRCPNVIPAEAGIQYMKFTIDWLKEFCPVRFSVKELAHRLTMSGLEVEHIEGEGESAAFTLGITPNRGDCLSLLGVA